MKAEEILNLFELIKDAPKENWEYNKSRLREILYDYEKKPVEVFVLDGYNTSVSKVTDTVLETLQFIKNTNPLEDILSYPPVREQFRARLYTKLCPNELQAGFARFGETKQSREDGNHQIVTDFQKGRIIKIFSHETVKSKRI